MKKYLSLIVAFVISYSTLSFAQKRKKGIDYPINVQKLHSSIEIIWYGVDFSHCKLTDASKIGESQMMKEKYIPGWIGLLNKQFPSEVMGKSIKGYKFSDDLNSIQMLYGEMNPANIVSFADYELTIDSISSFVKSYKLPQKSGTGWVLIIENLNKPHRFATGYFTFFDIETRSVLYATKMKGLPGSKYGFSQWWKEGLNELFAYYFRGHLKPVHKPR